MGVLPLFVIGFVLNQCNGLHFRSDSLPCDFQDSVNITNGILQSDGAIIFNGTKYSKDQFAEIDYIVVNESKRETVESHFRGCPCNVRPCIRLCCPLGQFIDSKNLKPGLILQQIPCYNHPRAKDYQSEILDENRQPKIVKLDEQFSFAVLLSPVKFFKPNNYRIIHTGQVLYGNKSICHRNYCLSAILNQTSDQIELSVLKFFKDVDQLPSKYIFSAVCMLISVPFIAATFLVYILLPELHNLHGNCMVCHLICLVIGYILTAWVKLEGWNHVNPILCRLCGYFMYFSLLSAFLWSNVISYDLWRNFRTTHMFRRFSDKKRFQFYMLYAWGLSSLLTLVIYILDSMQLVSSNLLPGVGVKTCFLQRGSQLYYFFMPLCIILSMNIVYFISTAWKIRQVQRDVIRMTSQEESARHQSNLNNGKDDLMLYMRLFVITGVTWIMEGVSFVISPESNVFRLIDTWNALQGLIIFISFVMKRRVLLLIHKRYLQSIGKATVNEASTGSSFSSKSNNLRANLAPCETPNDKGIG